MLTRVGARCLRVLKIALWPVLALTAALACGPDFSADTFVRMSRPDLPQQFVQGRLGILQAGFARADLFVAYRYLNGGTLDASEQKAWSPTYLPDEPELVQRWSAAAPSEATPLMKWESAREGFPDTPAGPIEQLGKYKVRLTGGYEYDVNFLNCGDDAFRVAAATLQARAKTWGRTSPYLLDWLRGQDAVFSNCSGGPVVPGAAPADAPLLLTQDRAYQVAAAHFYGRDFSSASMEFAAISKDRGSPWQPISGYVAARALIREAFFAKPEPLPVAGYDAAVMQAAAAQLRAYLAENPPPALRRAAEAQLALVRIRIEPEARARELGALLSGPGHDANYAQDLQDLLWLTNTKTPEGLRAQAQTWIQVQDEAHPGQLRPVTPREAESAARARREDAYDAPLSIREAAPVVDWALTVQSLAPLARAHAVLLWRSTHSLPWMVASLMLAPYENEAIDEIVKAAAAVPTTSPAWQTVTFHRARLLLGGGHTAEARGVIADFVAELEKLPVEQRPPSTMNAVRGLQMLAAPTEAEFFSYVGRTTLLSSSQENYAISECSEVMNDPQRHYDCVGSVDAIQMDADAAGVLNERAPLSVWLSAAKSSSLSAQLRGAIAMEGWTRAVLLGDKEHEAAFVALLPEALRAEAGSALGAWMVLVRNPGLRPYVNGGTQRAYTYDFVESFRDNWCYWPPLSRFPAVAAASPGLLEEDAASSLPRNVPAFLSANEQQQGTAEARRLAPMRSVFLGQQMLAAVKADVQNPQAAEALYLILRMVRYGCVEAAPAVETNPGMNFTPEAKQLLELKRDASRLLREHYAGSPWTKKAAPFAG